GQADKITPAREPIDLPPSPALSLIKKAPATLKGRKIGALITDGVDEALVKKLGQAIAAEGAQMALIGPKIGGVKTADGKTLAVDHALSGAPSVFFDAVLLLPSEDDAPVLAKEAAAVDWLRDAFGHLKVIGHVAAAAPIFKQAGIGTEGEEGVILLEPRQSIDSFIIAAKKQKIWNREPKLRRPG